MYKYFKSLYKRTWIMLKSMNSKILTDHFDYFKGKIVPDVSLGCPVVHGGYLKGKIGSLPHVNKSIDQGIFCSMFFFVYK